MTDERNVAVCPACGSKDIAVCELLGHVYPIRRCHCPRENHNDVQPGTYCVICGGLQ